MKNKIRDIIITITFLVLIFGFFILNIITEDKKISTTERRILQQFPMPTKETVFNGKYSKDFEKYAQDQFAYRDIFRDIKGFNHFKVYRQLDNNGYYIKGNMIFKQAENFKPSEIRKASTKINYINSLLTENNKAYYSIVPDKNYYEEDNDLRYNYEGLVDIFKKEIDSNITYIDLFDILALNDYYNTDTHWKNENLIKVCKRFEEVLGINLPLKNVKIVTKGEFDGVYSNQIGINHDLKDTLRYITTDDILASTTYNLETNKEGKIYDEDRWVKAQDKYDYFLSGATPYIEIRNPNNTSGKELIIFRDSFGSSITPLLVEGYSKITLVDLRYMSSQVLDKFITFTNQDVLFLYSTLVINNASTLR